MSTPKSAYGSASVTTGPGSVSVSASVDTAAIKAKAGAIGAKAESEFYSFKAALDKQYQEFKGSKMVADFVEETKAAFKSHKFTLAAEHVSPFPIKIFLWTFLVGLLWLYSVFVTFPTDPLVTSLHLYVDLVFFCAGGVGAVMWIFGTYTRALFKYYPEKLAALWELPETKGKCSRFCKQEMYLSFPHLISIGGMLLAVTFLELVVLLYFGPQFLAPNYLTELSETAGLLIVPAVLLVVAMISVRLAVPIDMLYLYQSVVNTPKFEDEFKVGTSKGATRCILGFGIGMLFLDGGLYKTAWAFSDGIGLPAETEAALLPTIDMFFSLDKWFFVPICFVGLSAIVVTIKRGLWVYPNYGQPFKEGAKTYPSYDEVAAKAFKEGKWAEFCKSRDRKWLFLFLASTAVLIGVAALIPAWTLWYFGVTEPAATACDLGLAAREVSIAAAPLGEITTAWTAGLVAGVPQLCELVPWLCSAIGTISEKTYTLDTLKELPLDIDKACEVAYAVNFWGKTMLLGLLIHLPAAMVAWHLVNRYTTLMTIKDIAAGRTAPPGSKSLV